MRRNQITLGKVMYHSFLTRLAATLAIASPLCVTSIVHAQTTYRLTQVGPNDQTAQSGVHAIDNEGNLLLEVISLTDFTPSTYLWHSGTQFTIDDRTPPSIFIEGMDMTDLTQIVGTTLSQTSGTFCGFVWSLGHLTELPSPAGSTAAFASHMNVLGDVLGLIYDEAGNPHQALWHHGKATFLPESVGQPVGIDIRGEILAATLDTENILDAIVWRHGVVTVVIKNANPAKITDAGQILGSVGSPARPFLWQNGVTTILPPLPGGSAEGGAVDINEWGQIVGGVSGVPVLWQHGTATDLNSRIAPTDPLRPYVHLDFPYLINNLGQIVAKGTDSRTDLQQTYLLTPGN